MNAAHESYYNLAERIEDAYTEIDSKTCTDLRNNDSKYKQLWDEAVRLKTVFPIIVAVTEDEGKISLSVEEHTALVNYLSIKHDMENIERKQIYFRGHMDNYAYLKKIGAI
ncbi:MAG: hypothetical protein LBI19_02340 [Oscillospiraceae bacterium]|jgi:predicted transposase YbfD/YdcC|nr:hypothetical protein [Oscillospiraceae bacterium]